jgi:hypothetical protein
MNYLPTAATHSHSPHALAPQIPGIYKPDVLIIFLYIQMVDELI